MKFCTDVTTELIWLEYIIKLSHFKWFIFTKCSNAHTYVHYFQKLFRRNGFKYTVLQCWFWNIQEFSNQRQWIFCLLLQLSLQTFYIYSIDCDMFVLCCAFQLHYNIFAEVFLWLWLLYNCACYIFIKQLHFICSYLYYNEIICMTYLWCLWLFFCNPPI